MCPLRVHGLLRLLAVLLKDPFELPEIFQLDLTHGIPAVQRVFQLPCLFRFLLQRIHAPVQFGDLQLLRGPAADGLQSLTQIGNGLDNIALDEINTVIEYEEMTNSFAFGSMEILSWLVFLFGVINLINTTLSNQIARKQENSILRSIGLTQKQLCKMNICEGLCYALFATLATLIVGLPASIFACRKMSVGAFAGNVVPYKFPVLEMGLFILVLFGMELILSVWTVRRQKKQSLIEQMRAME